MCIPAHTCVNNHDQTLEISILFCKNYVQSKVIKTIKEKLVSKEENQEY